MPVEEQVVVDNIPVESVGRFADELLEYFRARHGHILDGVRSDGKIPDEDALEAAIARFASEFDPGAEGVHEPDAGESGDQHSRVVDSDVTLPEEDVDRDEATFQPSKRDG
jgi:F-type H+-transporting ATPase subunit alpha